MSASGRKTGIKIVSDLCVKEIMDLDIRHHYIEKGQGEALVLLHGNGEDSEFFSSQIEAFSKDYHVYAVDTRGHGGTPRGNAPFTIRQFAEDLSGFFDEHGIDRAHILGFSDGANIAMCFALAYPDRVASLILNGGNLDPSGVKRLYQLPIEIGFKIASRAAEKDEKARKNAELLGLMVNDPNIAPSSLAAVHVPTLVIAGTRDMIKEKHTRLIAESIHGARLSILSGNHFLAEKHPDAFNQTVLDFLKSL